ncbi:hypothetical protein O181_014140 [Austropuccinia psidii MF-1]|uniref:Uncharacterized protein n=1 Tax=Austropuccinia psidii MF-1 TaxID=1389203 RepID=A0A9Q3C0E2_9BASI|nr:hypothetical protein [Austropuccinia psidii MF-1]
MLRLLYHPQGMPLWWHPSATYHPHANFVPSQHASNASLITPYTSEPPSLTIHMVLQHPQDKPLKPAPHLRTPAT